MHISLEYSKTSSQVHTILDLEDFLFWWALRGEDVPEAEGLVACACYDCAAVWVHR